MHNMYILSSCITFDAYMLSLQILDMMLVTYSLISIQNFRSLACEYLAVCDEIWPVSLSVPYACRAWLILPVFVWKNCLIYHILQHMTILYLNVKLCLHILKFDLLYFEFIVLESVICQLSYLSPRETTSNPHLAYT